MTMTAARASSVRTFDSTSPATGEVVGTFPLDGPEQVAAAVERAREAAGGWAGLGFDGRRRALLAYKALLVRRTDELVALVHRENGKPTADAWCREHGFGEALVFERLLTADKSKVFRQIKCISREQAVAATAEHPESATP